MIYSKKWVGAIALALLCVGILTLSIRSTTKRHTDNSHGLDAAPRILNFGKVAFNQPLQGEFVLQNTSQRLLHIISIKPSCSCLGLQYEGNTDIQPGEIEKLKISYTAGFPGGVHGAQILVEYQTPQSASERKQLLLPVTCETGAVYEPDANECNFGALNFRTVSPSHSIVFRKGIIHCDNIKSIKTEITNKAILAGVSQIDADSFVLNLKIDARGQCTGLFKEKVRIEAVLNDGSSLLIWELPVVARIQSPLLPSPQSIYFGAFGKSEHKTLALTILKTSFIGSKFVGLEIEPSKGKPPLVQLESDSAKMIKFKCSSPTQDALGDMAGVVKIQFSHKGQQLLVAVPYMGRQL